ncbi:MAG TPA: NIPSNAP family protein [Acidobacteriaceae bacterium]
MNRRRFLARSLATSAAACLAGTAPLKAAASTPSSPEFYQLRCYRLQSGPQTRLTEAYLGDALLPALTRLGMAPVGAFRLDIGPETPSFYVLIPGSSVETLVTVDLRLARDEEFMKAAAPFWSAPATAPAFVRVESSLLSAFPGWPRLTLPSAGRGKRIFQLRTYESPSLADHVRKVEMFHEGEFDIFKSAGLAPVFFGDTLIGPRLPSLTYMLTFASLGELDAHWASFSSNPAWQKLSHAPRYSAEELVSSITNLILSPLAASQI